ncbi:hypothetical protein HID58_020269 [Brassica napus]|uniref:FHA domain-containing protein n=1 Tax=Brassica napus TaxID=3708 RepID=A0ABQ8DGX6_BRANA|nr:hypothetical protein HID58_020269 [Brassica napus]
MVPPLLKLAFVQGPRDGESLEYKPGSTIRIGRIVRGNEIVVKDAGVSTKHLRIVSDSENWIVHDLGSSNGTILNSEPLDSDTPVILRHGDVEEEEHKLPPRPRRNNRRLRRVGRPRKNEKKVAVMKEEEEADTRIGVEISEMKRENVKCEDTVIEEKRRPSRATRSKKEAIGGDSFLELEMVLNQAKKSRAKKKKTEQKSVIVDKTEMMIEDMRSKSLRVRHHIAEQKQAKEEGSVN